jgi:hypothetical protein
MKDAVEFLKSRLAETEAKLKQVHAKAAEIKEEERLLAREVAAFTVALSAELRKRGIKPTESVKSVPSINPPNAPADQGSDGLREVSGLLPLHAVDFIINLARIQNGHGLTPKEISQALKRNGYKVAENYHHSVLWRYTRDGKFEKRDGRYYWAGK